MSEIPQDIWDAADAAHYAAFHAETHEHEVDIIARAIMAERERCCAECQYFIDNINISVKGRSRFTEYDLNREARRAVRYVMDKITCDFDKNWSDAPPSGKE